MSGRTSTLELSILGDALEEDRIQLENNLQQTDLSLHLSSPRQDYSDIEHPRHHSDPYSFSGIASFDRSREALEHAQPWAYRPAEDEDGYHPYGGETVSTVAHHASALTLTAGLGGRAPRRDISLSGAEYDPDRPVHGIMAGINHVGSKGSSRSNSSKSKIMNSVAVDFDPLVVDDTAELDRIFQSYRPEQISGLHSPPSSSTSEPVAPVETVPSPRPKLSDTLHRTAFSPKRPRVVPQRSNRASKKPDQPVTSHSGPLNPRDKTHQSLSYGAIRPHIEDPAVYVQPPTPHFVDTSSKFTKLARGITAEIQAESQARRSANDRTPTLTARRRPLSSSKLTHSPLRDPAAVSKPVADGDRVPSKPSVHRSSKGKVHLPDVTGLTSAVQSPSKFAGEHIIFDGKEDRQIDAQLMATLSVVQSKLAYLEAENSISRRRVRELEYELEECKREVAKERERVLDQGTSRTLKIQAEKAPGRKDATSTRADASRYEEVVEEKKALEELITTLRAHLTRLTAELSDHKRLLGELRTLRDQDSKALKEKTQDIDKLKQEVERLSGEVEVLRGVVEEGLRERRETKESTVEAESDSSRGEPTLPQGSSIDREDSAHESNASSPSAAHTSRPSGTMFSAQSDSRLPWSPHRAKPYINAEELDRISEELEERRSERSLSRSMISTFRNQEMSSCVRSPPVSPSHSQLADPVVQPPTNLPNGTTSPRLNKVNAGRPSSNSEAAKIQPCQVKARPEKPRLVAETSMEPERDPRGLTFDPLPGLGSHLEYLFRCTPQHDAQLCTLCRRRRPQVHPEVTIGPRQFWHPSLKIPAVASSKDGSYGVGPTGQHREGGPTDSRKTSQQQAESQLPPHTVLSEVLKELEDDFAHYKGIYTELADQYRLIDATSNVAKRNILAQHVREVIDILEHKGDQIASLSSLLPYGPKPNS